MEYLKPRLLTKIGIDADNLKMGRMPDGTPVGGRRDARYHPRTTSG